MRSIGAFVLFFGGIFRRIESPSSLYQNSLQECIKVGYKSLFIVISVSLFTGAVSAIQTSFNLTSSYIQDYVVAMVVRDTVFSMMPTLIALIYSGKVGSLISGELGTMKVTEQIDALEVMGINAKSYLVLPKMIASQLMFPILIIMAMSAALFGGFLAIKFLDIISVTDYIRGVRTNFNPFTVTIFMIKAALFGLLVPSISSFHGFGVRGGALEVGKASTLAVIRCTIAVIVGDYLVTQLLATSRY
ncbi:MAG: ABC transporter permease [Bacteroidota bacterium]